MTDKPGKTASEPTLPESIAAAAGMPVGPGDHGLRPDPAGLADPLGHPPGAVAGDFTLKPDPLGLHDPRPHAAEAAATVEEGVQATGARAADLARQASQRASDLAAQASQRAGDLAGQASQRVSDIAGDVQDRLSGAAEEARARASAAYDEARTRVGTIHKGHMRRIDDLTVQGIDGLNRGKGAVERFVDENPLLVGVVGVAAGLLLGALLPRTKQEDRNIGPWADEVRGQGLRYAREVTSKGREFVQTALDPDNLNAAARKVADADAPPPPANARTAHNL